MEREEKRAGRIQKKKLKRIAEKEKAGRIGKAKNK